VCDGNDAFAALNAFGDTTSCTCPLDGGGPQPSFDPIIVGAATLELRTSKLTVQPGDIVDVEVFLATELDDLRGYQLHAATAGGLRGALELIDISSGSVVGQRLSRARPVRGLAHVFAGMPFWGAYNIETQQMVAGLDGPGIPARAGTHLATLTYRVGADATGSFVVDLYHDADHAEHRTFLFPTPAHGAVDLHTVPAVVEVVPRRTKQ
jgi:hypothetical protein